MGHSEDPVQMARNIKAVGYSEWTDVVENGLYIACSECGYSHYLMFRVTGMNMYRVRVVPDNPLTDANREYALDKLPLYSELLALREENVQLKRSNAELSSQLTTIIEGRDEKDLDSGGVTPRDV